MPQPTLLADVLEVTATAAFRLLGRSNDLVNIAGKRSSLGHLDFHLNSIDGVVDGAFWLPPDESADALGVVRLVAFVVAPGARARERILAALRERVDAAFLPRRIVHVDALPREATGKLAGARLADLATQRARRRGPSDERARHLDTSSFASARAIRRSPATSRAGRCCRASRCSPRCSRRRSTSRRSPRPRRRAAPRGVKFLQPVRPGAPLAIGWRATARSLDFAREPASATSRSGQFARADAPAARVKLEGSRRRPRLGRSSASAAALWQLRLMRWLAIALGRPARAAAAAPIVCYFVLATARRGAHSRRYLERALGRPARWRDVYRHFHAFAATVLDRVYFLQERFDAFEFTATGIETILEPFERGEGVLRSARTSAASRRCARSATRRACASR